MARPALGIAALSDEKILALYDKGTYEIVPHDKMRKVIAERLTLAKQTIPHYYLSIDCRLDELLRARERMNAAAPREGPRAYKLSVNDFIIKAMALALQQVPAANATWTESGMLRHKYSDVGVAVAVEGGLFTPVVHQAEMKSLSEISNEMRDLADRARKRRLAPHEYQGGHHLDLQPRHVRHQELRRGHQPAARHNPGGRGGGAPRPSSRASAWSRRPS